jgi:hypothetical protein
MIAAALRSRCGRENIRMTQADVAAPVGAEAGRRSATIGIIVLGALLTFLATGYVPLTGNNVFHLHLLMETYNLDQFRDDAFVQTMPLYSSGFWLVFAGAGEFIDPKIFAGCSRRGCCFSPPPFTWRGRWASRTFACCSCSPPCWRCPT